MGGKRNSGFLDKGQAKVDGPNFGWTPFLWMAAHLWY